MGTLEKSTGFFSYKKRSTGEAGASFSKNNHTLRCSYFYGGATRNRTGDEGFADLCLTAWLWRQVMKRGYVVPSIS